MNKLYVIWDFSTNDYMCTPWGGEKAVLAFKNKRLACRYAMHAMLPHGFSSYTQAKRKGWCEVRTLTGP